MAASSQTSTHNPPSDTVSVEETKPDNDPTSVHSPTSFPHKVLETFDELAKFIELIKSHQSKSVMLARVYDYCRHNHLKVWISVIEDKIGSFFWLSHDICRISDGYENCTITRFEDGTLKLDLENPPSIQDQYLFLVTPASPTSRRSKQSREARLRRRARQTCIHFTLGICMNGDHCQYSHV